MKIIGELINSSREKISQAIADRDAATIQDIARAQDGCGADYIDVNAGTFVDSEPQCLQWLVEVVQQVTDKPCAIDSPDPAAIEAALSVHRGVPMINSISMETKRYEAVLPVVSGTDFKVIALCMSDDGMPVTAAERLDIAERLITGLTNSGVVIDNIFIDPLVQPISIERSYGIEFLDAVEQIRRNFPGVHTACGLSNISYGLPDRSLLNQTFMAMAIARGLDGAIVNPLDKRMMAVITAAETLAGGDEFCMNFLTAYRAGAFESL